MKHQQADTKEKKERKKPSAVRQARLCQLNSSQFARIEHKIGSLSTATKLILSF